MCLSHHTSKVMCNDPKLWEGSVGPPPVPLPCPQQPAHCLAWNGPLRSDWRMRASIPPHCIMVSAILCGCVWCLFTLRDRLENVNRKVNISSHLLIMMVPIFQMRKQRLRQRKLPVQSRAAASKSHAHNRWAFLPCRKAVCGRVYYFHCVHAKVQACARVCYQKGCK